MNDRKARFYLKNNQLFCDGPWDLQGIAALGQDPLQGIQLPRGNLPVSGCGMEALDTAGAWLLLNLVDKIHKQGVTPELVDFSPQHEGLLLYIKGQISEQKKDKICKEPALGWLATLGKATVDKLYLFNQWLSFIGELAITLIGQILRPYRFRWRYFLNTIETTGLRALPIIGFLSLLIGVVLTYQTGLQLKLYGANIYIVSILGTAVLREFGPLITAIILAGRTGSAFTALIGTMKVNEEIDALRTMGIAPMEFLVMPRFLGLICAMPLLTVWSDIFGVIGGMLMSKNILDINFYSFLQRFPEDVTLTSFFIGMGKTPVFAMIIAAVGCFQGFQVSGNAESVGWQTTKSVVLSIFLIIIADATFSIIFSWWKL